MLVRALTHRSFGADNNARLEVIGDGLVNAVVAELLYSHYPDLDEGSLSRLRSKLVSKEGLATLAERFELGPLVLLGAGERKSGGRHRASIMADTVEALAGGMLVEAGLARQVKSLRHGLLPMWPHSISTRREMPRLVCRNGCKERVTRCRSMRS